MERAVAAVQEMDQAEYQAKVCGRSVRPVGRGAVGILPGRSLRQTHSHPCPPFLRGPPFLWGLRWPTW